MIPGSKQTHFFTVDVEEHFQVSAFEGVVARADWARHPSRVEANTQRILDLLDEHGATATFFVLGWVAARHPELVREIVDRGHEAASHGYSHRRVVEQTREDFRQDVRNSKLILEDIARMPVLGYRAPSFSIISGVEWAFDVLIEEGYIYDSSVFPIKRSGYGNPGATPVPHVLHCASGHICEFPIATTVIGGKRVPAGGGAWFRHLPYSLTRRAMREHDAARLPGMFYIHPWEIDVDQPRLAVAPLTRLRHYGGLRKVEPRLVRLLSEFRFSSIDTQLPDIAGRATRGVTHSPMG